MLTDTSGAAGVNLDAALPRRPRPFAPLFEGLREAIERGDPWAVDREIERLAGLLIECADWTGEEESLEDWMFAFRSAAVLILEALERIEELTRGITPATPFCRRLQALTEIDRLCHARRDDDVAAAFRRGVAP